MQDGDLLNQLYFFIKQIGSGKVEPVLIVNNGKVVKMGVRGEQSYLYNRSSKDTSDNTQAIKHISERINSALKRGDTKEVNFTINFKRGEISKVSWESEFFLNMD